MENVLRFLVWYGPVLVIVLGLSGLLIYLRVYIKRQVRKKDTCFSIGESKDKQTQNFTPK